MEKVAGALSALGVGTATGWACCTQRHGLPAGDVRRLAAGAMVSLVNLMYAQSLDYFVNDSTPRC
jgi:hypothetical protein